MPEFFGICGRNNPRPCRLAWASSYAHPRVGTYPSDFLPARRTIFYAASDGAYSFNPPVISPGESFGLPLVGGFTIPGQFSGQNDVFTPDTRAVFSFCRTANRLNAAHVLTQSEIDSIDPETGVGEVNVGEFVFDSVAVTDQIEVINTTLTPAEIEQIQGTESESDRAFRKLFEQEIPSSRNRLVGVKPNKIGIEYRLDNGSPKAVTALETNGTGHFVGEGAANYRDGTSRTLLVNLTMITERLPLPPGSPTPPPGSLQAEARVPRAGDIIYLTYVAVREHYIRYSINAKWSIFAASLPPQCYGIPTKVKVAAFRFFEWDVVGENNTSTRVSGWRVVETHNVPVNFTAALGVPGQAVLGDFILGGGEGVQNVPYMPANSTVAQVEAFADNQALLPTYQVNLNQSAGDANYHLNESAEGSPNAYRRAPWYTRGNYTTYQNWLDAQSTVFFNVHPSALKKRDVDKFGIERFLAVEVEQDIKASRLTFFPFMDDSADDNPVDGSLEFMDSSNSRFAPIQPISRWTTSNLEIDCATGGGVALFPGGQGGFNGTGDVFAVFGIGSPIITERFEIDTRLLVEIFATDGAASGPNTIAIQGAAGGDRAVSCIADRIKQTAFVSHSDSENNMVMNVFDYGQLSDGLRNMEYRPDLEAPPIEDNTNPTPSQFQKLLGYSSMLGDIPGYKPGQILSVARYSDISKFKFKTTSASSLLQRFPDLPPAQIEEITVDSEPEKITIPVGFGLNSSTEINYTLSGSESNIEVLMLFRSGSDITGSVDSIEISSANSSITINHSWMRGDTIEIVGNVAGLQISNVIVIQMDDSIANDFLNETASSTESDINAIDNLNLYTRSVLFDSSVMSWGQDKNGRLFLFFSDKDEGISCIQSSDDGLTWVYHYGIVESINEIPALAPFVLPVYNQNKSFIFYSFAGKILCKSIPLDGFTFRDAFLIERFETDRFVAADEASSGSLPTERVGVFSEDGKVLRRGILSYAAAGDLTDADFLSLTGRNPDAGTYEPTEDRNIETRDENNNVITTVVNVPKNPIAIGSSTAFTNRDVEDIHFSVYRKTNGIMRLFFLGQAKDEIGGGQQLQCNFSSDDGIDWYDNWEWAENRYSRFRTDPTRLTSFIDRAAGGEGVNDITATDPVESQQLASFGVNVHWSRLKRHKLEGAVDFTSPSQVLPIEAPYVFYHSFLQQVFLFYVYSGCLLCKVFDDAVFDVEPKGSSVTTLDGLFGMDSVKNSIEKQVRSHFIDGDLSNTDLQEELHYFVNTQTNERQVEGNIVFTQQYAISKFNDSRTISAQRVCAYKFGDCNIRVFYKIDGSTDLKAATWNGTEWFVEEFLREREDETTIPVEPPSNITDVTGGFGSNGFGPVEV